MQRIIDTQKVKVKINHNTGKQLVITIIELLALIIFIIYIAYTKIKYNPNVYLTRLTPYPLHFAEFVAYPMAIFLSTILILKIINYLIKPNNIIIGNKRIRVLCLAISIIFIVLYGLFVFIPLVIPPASSLIAKMLENFNIITFSISFILDNTKILSGVTGLLLYLGNKA
ncbi:MAG: hypothetical protein WBJ83_00915 [Thermacetogeniaceae bacterium]